MKEPRNHITRRGLILGALSVGIVGSSGIAAGGTVAWFRDVESGDNRVEAGTLKLDFGSSSGMDLTKDLETDQSTEGTVTLVNPGSVSGSLDVDVSYTDSGGSASADEVARNLTVDTLTYGGTDLLARYTAIDTLEDLAKNDQNTSESNDLVDLADPTAAGTDFSIKLTRQTNSNNLDGNSIDVTVTFHLNQTDAM